ncbi:MAG: hypothetical protein AAGL34_10555 [Bacteroidota bacterium]
MRNTLIVFAMGMCSMIWGQKECPLGIGSVHDSDIVEIFQLNEEQQTKLKNWSAELGIRNDMLKEKARVLLKKHEESPPDVLLTMSKKYRTILDSMQSNSRMMDKRLLGIFNKKQYNFYVELCSGLSLTPLYVDGLVNEN